MLFVVKWLLDILRPIFMKVFCAVKLHFALNWFYAFCCAMVHPNHWITIKVNGGLKKTIQSLWKIDHHHGLHTSQHDKLLAGPKNTISILLALEANLQAQMTVSPNGSHYLLHCLGPDIPYTILRRCAYHRLTSFIYKFTNSSVFTTDLAFLAVLHSSLPWRTSDHSRVMI